MAKPGCVIEVLGPWLKNKGDVLNLWSVASRCEGSSVLAVSSTLGLDELPPDLDLKQIQWRPSIGALALAVRSGSPREVARWTRETLTLAAFPRAALRSRGTVAGQDVDVLLDCSGYAYGDVWTTRRLEQRAEHLDKLKENGAVAVMLPQALGPFERPEMRASAQRLFQRYDRIYARDEVSFAHLQGLELEGPALGIAPDITHLLKGTPPADEEAWRGRVCIVPNARMIDRTSEEEGDRYFGFVTHCIEAVRGCGLEPCIVVHETNDRALAEKLRTATGVTLPLYDEDALATKGVLGTCYALIGSRYHALISALSQATPSIGTSWSHKYEELFGDYGCSEFLMSPLDAPAEVTRKVERLLDPDVREALHEQLAEKAERQKAKVEAMWESVEASFSGCR